MVIFRTKIIKYFWKLNHLKRIVSSHHKSIKFVYYHRTQKKPNICMAHIFCVMFYIFCVFPFFVIMFTRLLSMKICTKLMSTCFCTRFLYSQHFFIMMMIKGKQKKWNVRSSGMKCGTCINTLKSGINYVTEIK
jgi:hypothetical protein